MASTVFCPGCGATAPPVMVGVTPAGRLDCCPECGHEAIAPDVQAQALAAARDADVAAAGAERVFETVAGPLGVGEVRRLRHDEQVSALTEAATHATGTPESVALYLRHAGFEIVAAPPVACMCVRDVVNDTRLRNPGCRIHGDVATVAVSGG